MKPTLHQLRIFRTVADCRGYTKAANTLHLSQPAVSMQVKQLEQQVDMPLLEQIGKKLFLTEAGEVMYQCAVDVERTFEETSELIAQLQGIQRGQLKLSVATTASYFVVNMLKRFSSLYPQIAISLDVTNRHSLLEQLTNNERDLIIMGEPPTDMDLLAQPFMDNPLIMIAAPNHPFTRRKSLEISDTEGQTFVIRETGSGTRAAIERFFRKAGVSIQSSFEMTSNEAIKQAVQAGLGLGIVSSHTVELELETGKLRALEVKNFPIMRKWYLVSLAGKRLSPVASLFESFIMDYKDEVISEEPA
jgi:DNA-binding transcriptional LysR family regulator